MALPPVTAFSSLPPATQTGTLDLLFEPSPTLHALALPILQRAEPFASYPDLIAAIRTQLLNVAAAANDNMPEREKLHAILGSHPRLGEARKGRSEGGEVSALSREEQRHLSNDGSGGVEEELARLNAEYEARFPGLRYVLFVNGRDRGEVLADMRRRIGRGDVREEEREAIRVSL